MERKHILLLAYTITEFKLEENMTKKSSFTNRKENLHITNMFLLGPLFLHQKELGTQELATDS